MPVPKGYKRGPEFKAKARLAKLGPKNPNWKGEGIGVTSGRTRALRLYPIIGPCVRCGSTKAERHHKDDNTANNAPSNIEALCRKCHMKTDGRLERFLEIGMANLPGAIAAAANMRRLRRDAK